MPPGADGLHMLVSAGSRAEEGIERASTARALLVMAAGAVAAGSAHGNGRPRHRRHPALAHHASDRGAPGSRTKALKTSSLSSPGSGPTALPPGLKGGLARGAVVAAALQLVAVAAAAAAVAVAEKSKKRDDDDTNTNTKASAVPAARAQEERTYEVESVLGEDAAGGTTRFMIKWRGYPLAEATWETAADCGGCAALIAAYRGTRAANYAHKGEATDTITNPLFEAAGPPRRPLQRVPVCVNFVVGQRLIKKRRFAAVVRSATCTSSGARVRRRGRDQGARATARL